MSAAGDSGTPPIPTALDERFRPLPEGGAPSGLVVRARVTDVKPAAYTRIFFPGARPDDPEFTRYAPRAQPQRLSLDLKPEDRNIEDAAALLDEGPTVSRDVIEEPGKTFTYLWLKTGTWSPAVPISLFGTFPTLRVAGMVPAVNGHKATRAPGTTAVTVTNVTVELELRYNGRLVKTLSDSAADGDRVTVYLALQHLGTAESPRPPGPEFAKESCGLLEYAKRRADVMEALPWAKGPLPGRYVFLSACSGWKVQTSNKEVYLNEYRTLRQLGCNGFFYGTWPGLDEAVRTHSGLAGEFGRARGSNQDLPGAASQYLLPMVGPVRSTAPPVGAGCPYHPVHGDFRGRVRAGVEQLMATIRKTPYDEYWFQTISEIGCVYDGAPERKAHMGSCPYCRAAFQEYVRRFGLTLGDFGARNWDEIRPVRGYFSKPYEEVRKGEDAASSAAAAQLEQQAARSSAFGQEAGKTAGGDPDSQVIDLSDEEARARESQAGAGNDIANDTQPRIPLPDYGVALLTYYTGRFNNETSARVFAPLREALVEQNDHKRKALAEGRPDSVEGRQPWVYSFALRGNSFLMGGHSLDFFEWYRHADNAFQYETSNRDPRVWEWESYLCDVGRIHQEKLGTVFSLMIKPGRGAVVQRTLTSVARKVRTIYWYTYGPDWHHPDTFAKGNKLPLLQQMSRTVHMIGESEDVLYDADWAVPAEVAVVRSDFFENNASWENGKWVYQALTHAHIPVDALDDGYLLTEDLARYKVIYVSGRYVRKDAAAKLAAWVEAGGVLYTSGGGLAFDESKRPLAPLHAALGLKTRGEVDLWGGVRRYGATALAGITHDKDAPAGARVTGKPPYAGSFELAVGREVLTPAGDTAVLASYADGGAAATRHVFGKGAVYVVGFYAGLEYASDILRDDYNMARDFRDDKRAFVAAPALAAGIRPVVDVSCPTLEGVLLKNAKTGRQAVILMNWAYENRTLVPAENVTLRIQASGAATRIRSLWLRETFKGSTERGVFTVSLPKVEDGDILLLE
jgi:hypothetical protein